MASLILLAGLCGSACAETLAPRAFSNHLARAFKAAVPSASVTVDGDLRLTIRHADGRTMSVDLGNAYSFYSRDSRRLDSVVQTHVAAWSRPPAAQTGASVKLDRSRIVPVVKPRQWLTELNARLKAQGVQQEQLVDDFADELVVAYAEDDPVRMRYLTSDDDIGDRAALRKLAVANLQRLLPKIEMRNHDDVFALISAGGDYEASLLLIDDIWSGGQIKVNGDIVVAIPARDVLLVTGSRNRTGLRKVRAMAAQFFADGPYSLTETLFVYRNGGFKKFGRN
jgi:uncharacterized protein YtpQ (UPF0354 family)